MTCKRLIAALACLTILFLFILYTSDAIQGSKAGLSLFLLSVLPAMLPFMILTILFNQLGIPVLLARWLQKPFRMLFGCGGQGGYIMLMSLLSGYPMGALLIWQNYTDKEDAQRIASFGSTAGIFFILSGIGAAMLQSISAGMIILVSHIVATMLCAIVYCRVIAKPVKEKSALIRLQTFRRFSLFDACNQAMTVMLGVGGVIIFFSVVNACIQASGVLTAITDALQPFLAKAGLLPADFQALIAGFLEMSNGCYLISQSSQAIPVRAAICAAMVSFGGLSVYFQCMPYLQKAGVRQWPYLLNKTASALVAFLMVMIAYQFIPL